MKLYTEEQVTKAIAIYFLSKEDDISMQDVLDKLKPIKILSDDEIDEALLLNWFAETIHKKMYIHGAKWMKEQILNQNK